MQLTECGKSWAIAIRQVFNPNTTPPEYTYPDWIKMVFMAFAADIIEPPSNPVSGLRRAYHEAIHPSTQSWAASVSLCWLNHVIEQRMHFSNLMEVNEGVRAEVVAYIIRRSDYFRQLAAVEQQQLFSARPRVHHVGGGPIPESNLRVQPNFGIRYRADIYTTAFGEFGASNATTDTGFDTTV